MGTQDEDKLPDAIAKRQVTVSVGEGKTIIVERWALAKLITMMSWLTKNLKDAASLFDGSQKVSAFEFAQMLFDQLGDKLPEFLRLAIGPAQQADVMELPADEALDVLVEVVKINITDKLVKKVKELLGLFKSKFPESGKST